MSDQRQLVRLLLNESTDHPELEDEQSDEDGEELLTEPSNIVKTKGDEKLWKKGKEIAKKAGADNKYAFANWFMQKQKGKK